MKKETVKDQGGNFMDQAGNGIIYITHILLARTKSHDSIVPARDTGKCSLAVFQQEREMAIAQWLLLNPSSVFTVG